jgi:hypothetical protein
LERQGLIRRRTDSRDARRFLVSLTERGRGFDGMEGTIEAGIQSVIAQTHVETLRSAREVLASLAVSLGSIATAPRTERSAGLGGSARHARKRSSATDPRIWRHELDVRRRRRA